MQTFTCHLASLSPYNQSYYFSTEKPLKMKPDEYDQLYWREHAHVVKAGPNAGRMVIPAQHFKNALAECAKYLSMRIAGKGQSTYSKNFRAGVLCPQDLVLPIKVAQKTGLPDPDEVDAGLDVDLGLVGAVNAQLPRPTVAETDHLAEFPGRIDVQQRKGRGGGKEGLAR